MRLSLKDSFHQLGVYLFSVSTVSDHSKLKWRFDRLDFFNALADLSDRSCIRGKGDEKKGSKKEQDLYPLFFLEIIFKIFHNNSGSKYPFSIYYFKKKCNPPWCWMASFSMMKLTLVIGRKGCLFDRDLMDSTGSSPAFNKNEGAYGSQIGQTVCYLLGYPLWMDHRRPAHGIQIIFLWLN